MIPTPTIPTRPRLLSNSPQVRERTNQVLQQTVQQRPDLSPEILKDQSKISDEFMEEVGKIGETQGYDPHSLSALAGNFLDKKADQGEVKQVGDKKGPKKTVEAKWEPTIRPGEVIPPQGKLGEVTSKTKSDAPDKVQAPPAAAGSQKSGQNGKDEKVEFSQETREMLNKMHSQGMKTPALEGGQRGASEKTDEVFMPCSPARWPY